MVETYSWQEDILTKLEGPQIELMCTETEPVALRFGKGNKIYPYRIMVSLLMAQVQIVKLIFFISTGMACGPVRSAPGSPVQRIVMVGGATGHGVYDSILSQYRMHIFDVDNLLWTTRKALMNIVRAEGNRKTCIVKEYPGRVSQN